MAHSFKSLSGKKTFRGFSEPLEASEYIYNKKARATYCVANSCKPSVKVGSSSNLLLFNLSNRLSLYPCRNKINTGNLNYNLITKLDLTDIPVIADMSNNIAPTTIKNNAVPYLDYNIDPSGLLFGNTICGINNYTNYMVYNPSYIIADPSHINNL